MILPDDFKGGRGWPEILDERREIPDRPAVYALVHERQFGRVLGESDILYIGATKELGGTSDTCRLRIYKYPGPLPNHGRKLRQRAEELAATGVKILFRWAQCESSDEAFSRERDLLRRYMAAHGELPPYNGNS